MPRLQVQPRGLFPDISFGREPSNSTGGTFTHVAAGFPGALPNPRHFHRGHKKQERGGKRGRAYKTLYSRRSRRQRAGVSRARHAHSTIRENGDRLPSYESIVEEVSRAPQALAIAASASCKSMAFPRTISRSTKASTPMPSPSIFTRIGSERRRK
jgi:hypothetical protein